jgi:uncharacterized protein YgbK (DUF1537 family)
MQIPGESIGIIADDLTGACDTALQFHLEGDNTRVLLDYTVAKNQTSTQAWVVHTNSRHVEHYDAVAAVKKSVHFLKEQVGLERFYKKIDSTLRGHIAQECLAMLDELRWPAAVIAPAYPDEGRRTVGGYQIVRGIPLGQTETAIDPLFAVRESHIPTLLGKTSNPEIVGYISLATIMDGAGPILRALQEQVQQNKKLIVVDACSDVDLEQISLAINKMPSDINILPCGSAGLAKALSKKWVVHRDHSIAKAMHIEKSPLLIVVGSASRVTREQVSLLTQWYAQVYPENSLLQFNLTPLQILGMDSIDQVVKDVVEGLKNNRTVMISTSYLEDSLQGTIALAQEQNLPRYEASQMASRCLGEITKAVLAQVQTKLLLTGGDTANQVCRAIGTRSLQIVDQVATSIPLTIDDEARWIITKSGGFGPPMGLVEILEKLSLLESQEPAVYG